MQLGIKHRVLLLALMPTIAISVLLVAYFVSTRLQDLQEAFHAQGEAMALKLAPTGEYGVFSKNSLLLEKLANTALKEPNVASVGFYTANGEAIAIAGKPVASLILTEKNPFSEKVFTRENTDSVDFMVPITIYKELNDNHSDAIRNETLIGWLNLELETKSMRLREYQILTHASIIFLLGLSISALLAYQMGHNLTRPILEIAEVVKRIREGALNSRIQVSSAYSELKMLGSGINTMAEALENAHQELQHKIDQATLSLRRTLETIEVQNIELEISRRAAENATKIKSEFLADMSHEIRTPLNGVVGFINLLQKTELNQKQREYINTIQKSANNLLAILNDILDFSKIEAGKLRIERSIMDIRDCIDEALNLLAPHAHEKNIALIPLIYSDVPKLILGDPLRIKQVVTNLVSNAIKFTDQGSVIIRVMVENESASQTTIRIHVTDTGIGLSPEEQKVLFQAFNQTKIGATHKLGGSGLGLVICKKLVEQMGGTIGVESEPHKGSTFWFTFQVETYEGVPPSGELPSTTFITDLNTQTPITILAVDDNPENLKLIRFLLEDLGIHVTTAESGKTAIAAVEQKIFHLILMDIRMPNMNGVETSQAIRKLEAMHHRKTTPIIALTAHALAAEKKALLETGINDYLAKPIGELELKRILQKWIKPPTVSKNIDWELGKKLAGNRIELAKEFFEKLIATLPTDKATINEDFLKSDWKNLRNHIHKLHGACCYCGVPELKNCAQKLETAVASEAADIIKPHLDAFNIAVDAVLAESENALLALSQILSSAGEGANFS